MTCKDCVHYEVCEEYLIECTEHGEAERILNPCAKFKSKANFVEVKHGHWIENDYRTFDGFETVVHPNEALKCSNCNHNFKKELLWCKNYCPNCGADMRKGGARNEQ